MKEVISIKELEALKRLLEHCGNTEDGYYECDVDIEDYELVETALEQKEKLEKAWEVVDKKQVAWGLIVRCQSVEEYNKCTVEFLLNETEFNLLKEMIK